MELALAVVKEESARAAALVAGSADLMDGEDASALRAACDATVLGFAESAGGVFAALRLDVEADPLHLIARACRLVTEHPWVLPADGLLRAARPIASALPALCQDLPPGPSRTINLLAREEAFCKDVHALYTGVLASCTAVVEAHAASVPALPLAASGIGVPPPKKRAYVAQPFAFGGSKQWSLGPKMAYG